MSQKRDWDRAKQGQSSRSSDDLFSDQRRSILKLGPDELLTRARHLYKANHAVFCRRCIESLKARRFTALCSRCLFRIGHVQMGTFRPRRHHTR